MENLKVGTIAAVSSFPCCFTTQGVWFLKENDFGAIISKM